MDTDTDLPGVVVSLRAGRHFRRAVYGLVLVIVLGWVTWWLDLRPGRVPGDTGVLIDAVVAGVVLGATGFWWALTLVRAARSYRAARASGGRARAVSLARSGVMLQLLGVDLAWPDIEWVAMTGPWYLRGPLARFSGKPTHLLFGVAEPRRSWWRWRFAPGTEALALNALAAYRTPFALRLSELAATPEEMTDHVRRLGRRYEDLALPPRTATPGASLRRVLATRTWYQWFLLLVCVGLAMGVGVWTELTPFRDAWLLEHGRPATATIVQVITPCGDRQVATWLISFTGQYGEPEYASTSDIWKCPGVGATVRIMYDPANPGHAGEIRALRNSPFKLFIEAPFAAFMLLMANMGYQFWRTPNASRYRFRPHATVK